jgi:hypothetical protein
MLGCAGVASSGYDRSVESAFCPRCGAYWRCSCPREDLVLPVTPGCEHDWIEAVAVDLDEDLGEAKVMLCRLCGLYAVQQTA